MNLMLVQISSSGVLPPEMIAKLTVEECERFELYFKEVKNEKITPKEFSRTEFFVVKAFLTEDLEYSETERVSHGEYKETVYTKHDHPIDKSKLPYSLVKATKAIDIWSFGVILYALEIGSPLFDVNCDDNLKAAEAMKEPCEWNDSKKAAKLEAVKDPLVGKLLIKILSSNPSPDRHPSMEEILGDEYFKFGNVVEYWDKRLDIWETTLEEIYQNTVVLRNTQHEILEKIRSSASVVLTAIFEATEVKTPTCFIILPAKIPVPG